MLRFIFSVIATLSVLGCCVASAAGIEVQSGLDKEHHLAGEPVYLITRFTNKGPAVERLDLLVPYCDEPTLEPTSLRRSMPPLCPDFGQGPVNCKGIVRDLQPGETHIEKYLLNDRFDLNQPGTYTLTVSGRTLILVLDRSSEQDLRAVYDPYFAALDSPNADRAEAIRALAGAGADFTQDVLLRISMDPRGDAYVQSIANRGLARLRTRSACARLAELAGRGDQNAIVWLGECADPGYMQWLFNLAPIPGRALATFALPAAAEAGGDAAVDRLLARMQSSDQDAVVRALGRTGSARAAKAIIDALPSLPMDTTKYIALPALMTLTHRKSTQRDLAASEKEWIDWWATPGTKEIFGPRDCRGGILPIR